MSQFVCESCGALVCDTKGMQCHYFRFPRDLAHCLAVLAEGPGSGLCARCLHINAMPLLSLVMGSGGRAILGAPEGNADLAALADVVARDLQEQAPGLHVAVTRTRREFKRSFLHLFIGPAARLMNEFAVAANKLDWVAAHGDALDGEFFAAMYLNGAGVFEVYLQPAERNRTGNWFTRSEEAPDDATHLVRTREALAHHHRQVGRIIGLLLLMQGFALRDGAAVDAFLAQFAQTIPTLLLDEEVVAAVADSVDTHQAQLDPEHPGFLAARYCIELPLALLCHAHQRPNPRRRQWTEAAFLHELVRLAHGAQEASVLSADLMRATLDEPHFWQLYTEYGTAMGFNVLTDENRAGFIQLVELAHGIYPQEAMARSQIGIGRKEGETDESFLERALRILDAGFAQGNAVPVSRMLCTSIQRGAVPMLPRLTQAIQEKCTQDASLGAADQSELLRMCVEALNNSWHIDEASAMAALLQRLIDETGLAQAEPQACAHAYNEIANVLRSQGERARALVLYESALDLLGRDPGNSMSRVAMRNRAIILRELHAYTEAIAACDALMAHASFGESRQLAISHAMCLLEMGEPEKARTLIESLAARHGDIHPDSRWDLSFINLRAFLCAHEGDLEGAASLLEPALPVATRTDYLPLLLVAAYVELKHSRNRPDWDAAAAIETIHGMVQRLRGDALDWMTLCAAEELNEVLCQRGRGEEAETLVRELVDRVDLESSPRSWQLHLFAAVHAERRGDQQRYRSDLLAAMLALQTALSNLAGTDDVRSFVSPQARAVADLVRRALALAQDPDGDARGLALHAADLLAAPVSTARLRRRYGLLPVLADPEGERQRLCRLLADTPAVLLQFVEVDDGILALQTMLDGEGGLATRSARLETSAAAAFKIAGKLGYALAFASVRLPDLYFDRFPGWPALRSELAALAEALPPGLPLAVVSGPLDDAIVSLAIGASRPLVFVPSMGALVALREGRAAPLRPARLFAFASWFSTEKEEQARTLAEVATRAAALGQHHALEVESVSGRDATRQRLLDGLEAADVAWLACHGKAQKGADSVDLYVAAQGNLPVQHLDTLVESQRRQHLVNWQELAALEQGPGLVLSSACESGLIRRNPGGERLGLERPLFAAGCRMFVAPLWQVPTREIQSQASAVLEAWLAQPGSSLAQKVWQARIDARNAGVPCLAGEAFAVFGDAL